MPPGAGHRSANREQRRSPHGGVSPRLTFSEVAEFGHERSSITMPGSGQSADLEVCCRRFSVRCLGYRSLAHFSSFQLSTQCKRSHEVARLKTSATVIGVGLLSLLAGCATKQDITRIDGTRPRLVCIVQHEAVKSGVLDAIQDGLKSHGVGTKLVSGAYENKHSMWFPRWTKDQVTTCDALLFYVANWNWDLALYMRFANIWMTTPDGSRKVGQATYDSSGNAGLGKFIDARKKILELVDQMLAGTTPPTSSPLPIKADTKTRMEELDELKIKGLISEQEYLKKRQDILSEL